MSGTICAAVLTYNRQELLARCLEALLGQSEPPDRILVIDNGSEDGTGALLEARGYLANPLIQYVRLPRNIGPARGWETLFRHVHEGGFDWGWFMDDDVIAGRDALAALKRAYAEHFTSPAELGYLTSLAFSPDGTANDVPIIDDRHGLAEEPEWACFLAHGMVKIRSCALNSVLIPRSTFERFGAPCPDYVVWGEDTDYTLRVSAELPCYLVGTSQILNARAVSGELSIFTDHDPERLERFYYLYRNTFCLRRLFWPRRAVYFFAVKAMLHTLRCLGMHDRPLRRAWLVLSGLVAGLFFRPRYRPFLKNAAERPSQIRRVEAPEDATAALRTGP
jgi:GT2 family glycosyltransferase